jgi:hypothetical protein
LGFGRQLKKSSDYSSAMDAYTQKALEIIHYLSVTIGGRGSCREGERLAGEYVADQMRRMAVQDVAVEPFRGAPSTYRPFILAFSVALVGTLAGLLLGSRWALAGAALANLLGTWAMIAEADLSGNWTRWLLPGGKSQNAVGTLPAIGAASQQVVLCAHLDTHRTPVFYSSKRWHRLFGLLVTLVFLNMVIGALVFGIGVLINWSGVRWVGLLIAPLELFALVMVGSADFSPFSPGANDNASGVGVIFGLAERLRQAPLATTTVHLAFTGCEEVGSYGFAAFLDRHAKTLGAGAVYIILDEVALGQIKYLSADGLILKRATHPAALDLARRAATAVPQGKISEEVGLAYTDALVATQRGLIGLTISCSALAGDEQVSHWHQMSDTPEHLNLTGLQAAHQFAWQLLQEIDRA